MQTKNKTIGFLFDLDGVIIDSESQYTKIWSKINEKYPSGFDDLAIRIKGTTLTKILNDYYPEKEIQEKVANRLHELEAQMRYEYLPYAFEFLSELKKEGVPCVLVTSSDSEKMEKLWIQLPELKDFFTHIITGDEVSSSKPSPEGYLLGAKKLNIAPEKCVVFEDSLQGVMAGKNAGAFVVGVAGTLPEESLAPYSHKIIRSFKEIELDKLILKIQDE